MSFQGDFDQLWQFVSDQYHAGRHSIHGPEHWQRVLDHGLKIAKHSEANEWVVRLFALFHDSKRINEGYDPGHGLRGADFALELRGKHFELNDEDFQLLYEACQWHTDHRHHDNATIGTCWDADRLDLGRVGTRPDEAYMSTSAGKKAARAGTTEVL